MTLAQSIRAVLALLLAFAMSLHSLAQGTFDVPLRPEDPPRIKVSRQAGLQFDPRVADNARSGDGGLNMVASAPTVPAATDFPAEPVSPGVARSGAVRSPSADAVDLKFREMFTLPVGPRGLQPSEKLLRLDGKRVRMVGYLVMQQTAASVILSPLPVTLGDEDESLADDLPPSVVFVHFSDMNNRPDNPVPGLVELVGTLSVGNFPEADGRVSAVRLTVALIASQEMRHHVPGK